MARPDTWPAVCAAVVALALAPEAMAGGESLIGHVSGVAIETPDGTGGLTPFGVGFGVSLAWLERFGRQVGGMEVSAVFVGGDDGRRFYDLGFSVIGSINPFFEPVAPFVSVGLDASSSRLPGEPDGLALGVHGNVGVHGVVGKLYWRAQAGHIGAGIGGLKGELSLGLVFD